MNNRMITSRLHEARQDSPTIGIPEAQFEIAVLSTRGYVSRHLFAAGKNGLLDEVLQKIRIEAWQNLHKYDSDRAAFGAYVQGIAKIVVAYILRETTKEWTGLIDDVASETGMAAVDPILRIVPDPLHLLVGRFERRRWAAFVADEVGESDWEVATALALDDRSAASVAEEFGLKSDRAVERIRLRVRMVAVTVRKAMTAAYDGLPADRFTAARCVPADFGHLVIAAALPLLATGQMDKAELAGMIGLSKTSGEIRSRIRDTEFFLAVAGRVLIAEAA